jgi:hypothetical protein
MSIKHCELTNFFRSRKPRRKIKFLLYIRINYLPHDAIEGQMTEVKGVGRRRYWELMEEDKDRTKWK